MNSLEDTLSTFERQPLPPEWKEDLLDAALAGDPEVPVLRPRFGPVAKLAWGAIAACWVAIAWMHLTTPASPGTAELADRFGIEEDQVYLLASRISFASRPGSETFPTPY